MANIMWHEINKICTPNFGTMLIFPFTMVLHLLWLMMTCEIVGWKW